MARIGIAITKSTAFRNATQEFSNVYYYESIGGLPSLSEANALIDELVAVEKTFHSTAVTFVRGRLWSETGNKATSEMIAQKNLSGTGATPADSSLDKERAWLFRIRAGVDNRGNPVYLRKWFHACGQFISGQTLGNVYTNASGWSQAQRDGQVAAMQTIGAIGGGTEDWKLCSKVGRFPTAGAGFQAHEFLEHHQFGDQWRGR